MNVIAPYTVIDYPMFHETMHEHAEEQLAKLKRRAEEDQIEDHTCLLCGKEFCLIIPPKFFQCGLRELCVAHAQEYNSQRKDKGGIYGEHEWVESKRKDER